MNNDKEIITSMIDPSFWGQKWTEINYCDRTLVKTPVSINLPSHWSNYNNDKKIVIMVAGEFAVKPRLLIWGNPNKDQVEEIWWDVMRSSDMYAMFLDQEANQHEGFLMDILLSSTQKCIN